MLEKIIPGCPESLQGRENRGNFMKKAMVCIALMTTVACGRVNGGEAEAAQINARRALSQIEALEFRMKATEDRLRLVSASLDESRENHRALMKTFNENVERANGRDASHERQLDELERRFRIYR